MMSPSAPGRGRHATRTVGARTPGSGPGVPVTGLTVLYDARCRLCRSAIDWLAGHDQLVPLEFVPAGSGDARRRFPHLDHTATMRDVTVVADTGQVWVGDGAWLTCLWALRGYRGMSRWLASPRLRPLVRRVVSAAAGVRARQYGSPDDRAGCVHGCHP